MAHSSRVILSVILACALLSVCAGKTVEEKVEKCSRQWEERLTAASDGIEAPGSGSDFDVIATTDGKFAFKGVPVLGEVTKEEAERFFTTDCDVRADKATLFFGLRVARQAMTKILTVGGAFDNMRKNVDDLGPIADGELVFGPTVYHRLSTRLDGLYGTIQDWWKTLSTEGKVSGPNDKPYELTQPLDLFSALINLNWSVEKDVGMLIDNERKNLVNTASEWKTLCNSKASQEECLEASGLHEVREEDGKLIPVRQGGRCIWKSKAVFKFKTGGSDEDRERFKSLLSAKEPFNAIDKEFLMPYMTIKGGSCEPCDPSLGECSQLTHRLGASTTTQPIEGTDTHCRLSNESIKKATTSRKLSRDHTIKNISSLWGCHEAGHRGCCVFKSNRELVKRNLAKMRGDYEAPKPDMPKPTPIPDPMEPIVPDLVPNPLPKMGDETPEPKADDMTPEHDEAADLEKAKRRRERKLRKEMKAKAIEEERLAMEKAAEERRAMEEERRAMEKAEEKRRAIEEERRAMEKAEEERRAMERAKEERRAAEKKEKAKKNAAPECTVDGQLCSDLVGQDVSVRFNTRKTDPRKADMERNKYFHGTFQYHVEKLFWSTSEVGNHPGQMFDEDRNTDEPTEEKVWFKVKYNKRDGEEATWTFPAAAIKSLRIISAL